MLLLRDKLDMANSAETIEDLTDRFQEIVCGYGFSSFSLADITKYDVGIFSIDTDKTGWLDFYRKNNFVLIDPNIDMLRKANSIFTWNEASENTAGNKNDKLMIQNLAYDFGFREGIIIPIHYVDPFGRRRSAVCTLFWRGDLAEFERVMRERRAEVEIVAGYWARKFVEKIAREGRKFAKNSDVTYNSDPRSQLTPREIDVLTWAAQGKTSSETATILGISTETVNHHLKYAISKMKVSNKVQAVAHAIYNNLIHP